jgi:hypothetical protein
VELYSAVVDYRRRLLAQRRKGAKLRPPAPKVLTLRLCAFARAVFFLQIFFFFAAPASAHEGPPFPLFVDQKIDGYLVSVWTDPDVGAALFFVIVSSEDSAELPADLRVQIGVQPVSGRLSETFYAAERENLQQQIQYRAEVHFDAEELWRVRVRLESAQGNAETIATVQATPPGYGRWDLLLYLFPFLAIGALWTIALIRRIRRRRAATDGDQ